MYGRNINFALAGFYCAIAFIPSLVFANEVNVKVSPTTGYYSVTSKTFSVPKGATVSSSTSVSPVVTPISSGGFQQSMGAGITIEGLKKPAPFTARAAASLSTMKNAAKKLAKSNPARFTAGLGLSALLDSVDWIIEDSKIVKSTIDETFPHIPVDRQNMSERGAGYFSSQNNLGTRILVGIYTYPSGQKLHQYCNRTQGGMNFATFSGGSGCWYYRDTKLGPNLESRINTPVSNSDVESSIDSKYNPDASDFVLLTPYMPPDYLIVDPIPPVETVLSITTKYDSEGLPAGTEEKTSTTEFSISNNSSSSPAISANTSTKTESFVNGQSQGSTVTDTSSPAAGSTTIPSDVEIPTDCAFHPTLCKWLDWTQETPDEPDLDLKPLLKETNVEMKTFTIIGSDAACPAPIAMDLSFLGNREVSYQPLCDLATTMKPLYLALMAFLSALLIHRSISNV